MLKFRDSGRACPDGVAEMSWKLMDSTMRWRAVIYTRSFF